VPSRNKLLVGIDEAGYGPNLGPLVVVAMWLEVPADTPSFGLWERLHPRVGKCGSTARDAIVVDDSKKVYNSGKGLERLERAALAWLSLKGAGPQSLRQLWADHCVTAPADIDEVPWHADRDLSLPRHATEDQLDRDRESLAAALSEADFGRVDVACQIVLPRRFNELVRQCDTKSTALFQVGAELLQRVWMSSQEPRIEAVLDKHGGRNFYRPLLQQYFNETLVLSGREGAAASDYVIAAGGRELHATFVPKADANHLLVAWASMLAKYLRESWMTLFNEFWVTHVPGLRPTAGYPVDARRFLEEIRPATDRLGVARDLLWRER